MTDPDIRIPEDALAELDRNDVAELRELTGRINSHDGPFGYAKRPEPKDDGVVILGNTSEDPLVTEAVRWLHARGLLDPSFVEFSERTIGHLRERRDVDVAAVVARLDTGEVLGLMAKLVRADRFCDGALVSAFDNGTMPALFGRLLELASGS
ncbi:DUF6508 domain-containing protein [Prescottella agglutinans]|uniref:DUF6508 domain-containing protein n=1 Tax=Prescottella agglutinans TaxID=1644129 RepID=UPI003D9904AA